MGKQSKTKEDLFCTSYEQVMPSHFLVSRASIYSRCYGREAP